MEAHCEIQQEWPTEKWEALILKDLCDKYRQCDYILGPMCGNGAACNDELWQPLGFRNGRPQVCVKSEHMAECIGNRENICALFL